MPTALITGANRGLGLALATRYAARPGARVIAVTRESDTSGGLHALVSHNNGSVRIVQADISDATSIDRLANEVGDATVDLLVNNAGVPGHADFGEIAMQDLIDVFSVNAFAPLLVTQA